MKLLYVTKDLTLMSRHPWSLCVAVTESASMIVQNDEIKVTAVS